MLDFSLRVFIQISLEILLHPLCYELMPLESDNRTTLVLSNTRELDRVPSTE